MFILYSSIIQLLILHFSFVFLFLLVGTDIYQWSDWADLCSISNTTDIKENRKTTTKIKKNLQKKINIRFYSIPLWFTGLTKNQPTFRLRLQKRIYCQAVNSVSVWKYPHQKLMKQLFLATTFRCLTTEPYTNTPITTQKMATKQPDDICYRYRKEFDDTSRPTPHNKVTKIKNKGAVVQQKSWMCVWWRNWRSLIQDLSTGSGSRKTGSEPAAAPYWSAGSV